MSDNTETKLPPDSGSAATSCSDGLKLGANVWIYDGLSTPRTGVVTKYGLNDFPNTWYVRDEYGERLYNDHRLFTDPEKLIAEVEDTILLMRHWLQKFSQNS